MKKVIKYEAEDGELFDSEVCCVVHENGLWAADKFDEWYANDENTLYTTSKCGIVYNDEMRDWLVENKTEVVDFLANQCTGDDS